MQELLFYIQLSVTALAIMWYIFAAFQAFKYLTGQLVSEDMKLSVRNLTLLGLLCSILSIVFTAIYNISYETYLWDYIMVVSFIDIVLNAIVLHMFYWSWQPFWPAMIATITIFIDALLRVMFTKYF